MAEAKEAWTEVGAAFGGLGEKLKEHFSHPPSKAGGAAAAAGATSTESDVGAGAGQVGASGDEPTSGDTGATDALKDAFRSLGDALNVAVEAVGAAAKDPAIAADVRHAGQAFVNALSTTFTDAGDEVRKAFNRNRPSDDTATTDVVADDVTPTESFE